MNKKDCNLVTNSFWDCNVCTDYKDCPNRREPLGWKSLYFLLAGVWILYLIFYVIKSITDIFFN
jgi:hypothetical protein